MDSPLAKEDAYAKGGDYVDEKGDLIQTVNSGHELDIQVLPAEEESRDKA